MFYCILGGQKLITNEQNHSLAALHFKDTECGLEELCRKYGVARLSLFGSASRNELSSDSDVDLMVDFLPDSRSSLFDITMMQDEFSAAFGGPKVDMVSPQILHNPFRRDSIVPDLKLIYEVVALKPESDKKVIES